MWQVFLKKVQSFNANNYLFNIAMLGNFKLCHMQSSNKATSNREPYTTSNSIRVANLMVLSKIAFTDCQLLQWPIPVFIKKLATLVHIIEEFDPFSYTKSYRTPFTSTSHAHSAHKMLSQKLLFRTQNVLQVQSLANWNSYLRYNENNDTYTVPPNISGDTKQPGL